jgi:2-(1,2-epoxy-1,2-dihydrophenyl)acetyl-CoA isomerase
MSMKTDELVYEVKDKIATITLNRPDKMNAFTGPMIDAWAGSLQEAQRDPDVNVVIVTGSGKAFCSGGDVARMGDGRPSPLDHKNGLWENIHRVPKALEVMDKPAHLDLVSSHMAVVRETSDHKEGVQAFKDKRKPNFTGR